MELTQVDVLNAVCEWLNRALEGLKLKAPVITESGADDPYNVRYSPVAVYPYYIPMSTMDESGADEALAIAHSPSVTVIPTGVNVEGDGAIDELQYGIRLMLLTYDPGVRPDEGEIELPDRQGHEGALALSDRIILSLRRAGRIGGLSINGVRAKAWEQSGQVVDMRPFYRTVIEFGLSGYLQSVRDDMALLE